MARLRKTVSRRRERDHSETAEESIQKEREREITVRLQKTVPRRRERSQRDYKKQFPEEERERYHIEIIEDSNQEGERERPERDYRSK